MKVWKILARHKNISRCTITESISIDRETRRFSATICGWNKWVIYQGKDWDIVKIVRRVKAIRQLIDHGIENIFYANVQLKD